MAATVDLAQITYRQGTAAQWTTANPLLGNGEPGYETDTQLMKIGDGVTLWNALGYLPSLLTAQVLTNKDLTSGTNTFPASLVTSAYTTTATAAGTTTLVAASTSQQFFTGVTTQTVVLPVTSTLTLGQSFRVVNNSSGIVTVQSSGANTVLAIPAGDSVKFTCVLVTGTTAASWDAKIDGFATAPGGSGALTLIETKLLAATATSVTFNTSLSGYKDLILTWNVRTDYAGSTSDLKLTVNGDVTTNNYPYERILTSGATISTDEGLTGTGAFIGGVNGDDAPAGMSGSGEVVLRDYAGTTFNKRFSAKSGYSTSSVTGGIRNNSSESVWLNTAAITSVTVKTHDGSNMIVNSVLTMYGRN